MAAVSGHMAVLRFLLEKWPEGIAVPTYGPVTWVLVKESTSLSYHSRDL